MDKDMRVHSAMAEGPARASCLAPANEPTMSAPDRRTRILLMSVRQALIIILGAIEDYLGVSRSIVPRRKRDE